VIDVYGVWRVDNNTSWRLTLSNLDPRYYNTNSYYNTTNFVENNSTRSQSWINAQIRLEKKL
jgi:outer membrane receptor for ferrienterochelin and colicins